MHLRSLDRQCLQYFDRLTRPPAREYGGAMCGLDWGLAQEILRARDVTRRNVFLASDGTNASAEQSFRWACCFLSSGAGVHSDKGDPRGCNV